MGISAGSPLAGLRLDDVVFGDGLAAPLQSEIEVDVLNYLQQNHPSLRYTSAAGALGFCGVAAGALSAAHALLGLRHAVIPPMVNCTELAPDFGESCVRFVEHKPFDRALAWSSDRGFDHVALVLERYKTGAK